MYEQVHHKQQTAQMATLTAHRERERWEHEGGPPPLHSHYGQVGCVPPSPSPSPPPPLPPLPPLSLLHHLVGMIASLAGVLLPSSSRFIASYAMSAAL